MNVTGGANTSTISTTGGGILLVGATAGAATEFNVADGAAGVDLLVSGQFTHRSFGDAEALLKTGPGTMSLTNINSYAGGTTVNGGALAVSGGLNGYAGIRGNLVVNSGANVSLSNDDGTGLGWRADQQVTELVVNGGAVNSAGAIQIWNLAGGVNLTGGSLSSNGGVSTTTGPQLEWANTTLTSNASADTATVTGRINIRRDAASVLQINVADGAAATDLLISAALTESASGCGLAKSGTGTLKLTGAVNLTGLITVSDGTLDLSSATLRTGIRINVLSGAHFIPPSSGLPASAIIYVNGNKLAPGTWGAPGSVAASLAQYESPVLAGSTVVTSPGHRRLQP